MFNALRKMRLHKKSAAYTLACESFECSQFSVLEDFWHINSLSIQQSALRVEFANFFSRRKKKKKKEEKGRRLPMENTLTLKFHMLSFGRLSVLHGLKNTEIFSHYEPDSGVCSKPLSVSSKFTARNCLLFSSFIGND